MNKKYWMILAVTNVIMGVCGYVLMAFGFLAQIATGGMNVGRIYLILAVIGLVLLFIFYGANRTLYRGFSERSAVEIPNRVRTIGNLTAWATLVFLYIMFSFL